jgi:hypothetical protein
MRWGFATFLVLCALVACGCGQEFVGDCSGGTPDDGGYCIPDHHAASAIEQVAISHYQDKGQQVDRVACYTLRVFDHANRHFTVWRCSRVANGDAKEHDDPICIVARHGQPVAEPMRARLPPDKVRCF